MQVKRISNGVFVLNIQSIGFNLLAGSPADVTKMMTKTGLIHEKKPGWFAGPDAILLSDVPIQNGALSNLCEFPVLQMLYKQGMMIPGHPGNTGKKPILIGTDEQLKAQLDYIHRGNYGLTSKEELSGCGLSEAEVSEMFSIKKHFAFGMISTPENMIDTHSTAKPVTLDNGLVITRQAFNRYRFEFEGKAEEICLSLGEDEFYEPAVYLTNSPLDSSYFSVIHSGDGDGWDPNRPCMGSVICFDGDYYLIDACPNIANSLNCLGISLTDLKGVFITHCHDDHFAGLPTLFNSPKRINFYATPWVRMSVSKKLCALLSIDYDQLSYIFNIRDLNHGTWNDIDGLGVMPQYSPHPVETSTFTFRVLWQGGYKSYSHLADVSSFMKIDQMARDGAITKEKAQLFKDGYLKRSSIKKVDIGGGLIHGESSDYKDDRSDILLLSHTDRVLSSEEKSFGSAAQFGTVSRLIKGRTSYDRDIIEAFKNYCPAMKSSSFKRFLHCDTAGFNGDKIILKESEEHEFIYLILKGVTERIDEGGRQQKILSGTLIGFSELIGLADNYSYRTKSMVLALKIPSEIFVDFIGQYDLKSYLYSLHEKLSLISESRLFREIAPTIHFKELIPYLKEVKVKKGESIARLGQKLGYPKSVFVIARGKADRSGTLLEDGDVCLESNVFCDEAQDDATALEDLVGFFIGCDQIQKIPHLYWKLFEIYTARRIESKKLNLLASA